MARLSFTAVGAFLTLAISAQAQWINHPSAGVPRTKDGRPILTAPAPKTSDGKPDLSGVWTTDPTPRPELDRLFPGLSDLAVPGATEALEAAPALPMA